MTGEGPRSKSDSFTPSERLQNMQSLLKDKKITIGISGGIAAYKIPLLIRLLSQYGASVQCVVTNSALDFVTETLLFRLTNKPVLSPQKENGWIEDYHITVKNNSDLFILAPGTLNTIGKIAAGIADDPLTTVVSALFAKKVPLLFVPSMNIDMWNNPILQDNIKKLKNLDVHFCGPNIGELACGEFGLGKMSEPEEIFENVVYVLSQKKLSGKKVLITAGPTREHLDPIRFISNISSGSRGYAMAKVCAYEGAEVTLISGPSTQKASQFVHSFKACVSAQEMFDMVMSEIKTNEYDYFISVAAVSDFAPLHYYSEKLPKQEIMNLELKRNEDILGTISGMKNSLKKPLKLIGFAAQTHNTLEIARKKLKTRELDLIIANTIDQNFSLYQHVTLIDKNFNELVITGSNESIAQKIIKKML